MRNQFGTTLVEIMSANPDVIFITGDTGNATVAKFAESHPDQYLNVGIAEQNMAGVAAGMAMMGKTIVMNSIGNFPTLRCYEQIRNDIAYHHLNVKICSTGGGFGYGPAGATHHGTEDFAVMRAMPGLTCFAPGDPVEVDACVRLMMSTEGPSYMRIGYHGEPTIHGSPLTGLAIGQAVEILDGNRVAILTAGNILEEGHRAARQLNDNGISTGLYSFPTIKPIDTALIETLAARGLLLITMEEDVLEGGFGSAVAEVLAQAPVRTSRLQMIGLHDRFAEVIGSRRYLRDYYGVNADSAVDLAIKTLQPA